MKTLRIPVKSEEFIDVSEISENFKGIIIGYKNNKAVGYLQYSIDNCNWYFMLSSNDQDFNYELVDELLIAVIETGIKEGIVDEYKVIEFEN